MDKKSSTANIEAYKKYRNEYKKTIQKTRNTSWNDYKEKIDSLEGINKFRKIIEKHVSKKVGTLERNDGRMTEPGNDTLQHLAETHFTSAKPLKKTVYDEAISKSKDEIHSWNPKWVNLALIKIALKQFHNKKSPGPDGIKPIVLKYLTDHAYKTLLFIYKACLLLSFTPTAWKGCRIVFIPKPGKSTYKLAKSWRPISLTNYMLKGLERLCGWHMDEQLKTHPIHTKQHGFRNDRNTETAISEAVNYIEKHIMNNQHTVGVFLDIQAAFDTISPKKIKESLLKHGGDPIMVGWYDLSLIHI